MSGDKAPARYWLGAPYGSSRAMMPADNLAGEASMAGVAHSLNPSPASLTGAERLYWYFAEGSSFRDDRETIAFINPGRAIAYVLTQLIRADGHRLYVVTDVPPFGRGTLDAGFAAGDGDLLAAIVRSNVPIVAERTVYHGSTTEEGTGSALTTGIRAPAHVWYLPRLKIASDEVERIAILNPNQSAVRAYVSFVRNGRLQTPARVLLQPLSVVAVGVPGGVTSAVVTSTAAGGGVVVEERTLYSRQRGYTVLQGTNAAVTDAYVPSPGAGGAHDFLMLLNPNNTSAALAMNVVGRPAGSGRKVIIPAHGQLIQRLNGKDIGDNSLLHLHASQPVAIAYAGLLPPSTEASLARTYRGSVVANATEPALVHVFAEGDSRSSLSDLQEILQLANPNVGSARVTVTMLSTGGRRAERTAVVPGGRTIRIGITGWGPAAQHGLVVVASAPIVAARTIDFNQLTNRLISYGATP